MYTREYQIEVVSRTEMLGAGGLEGLAVHKALQWGNAKGRIRVTYAGGGSGPLCECNSQIAVLITHKGTPWDLGACRAVKPSIS